MNDKHSTIAATEKQIANWRRIRVSIDPYLTNLEKINDKLAAEKVKYDEKVAKLMNEAEDLRKTIEMYEYPVQAMTGGYTTQDIFVKEVVTNDKVAADGRTIRKSVYNLRFPDTIVPPSATGCCNACDEVNDSNPNTEM